MKIEDRGSTGRTIPNNIINAQVAMEQVKSNPLNGAKDTGITLNDIALKVGKNAVYNL